MGNSFRVHVQSSLLNVRLALLLQPPDKELLRARRLGLIGDLGQTENSAQTLEHLIT